jgi:hypothetical protein
VLLVMKERNDQANEDSKVIGILTVSLIPSAKTSDEKDPNPPKALTGKSVTVEPQLPNQLANAIANGNEICLVLWNLEAPANWHTLNRIRVFVNNSNADENTKLSDSSFVIAVVPFPSEESKKKAKRLAFPLATALERLRTTGMWKVANPIQVTFVVVPPDGQILPNGLSAPFEKFYLVVE